VGGLFRHVRDLAREQVRRGYDVGVVCDGTTADSLTEARLAQLDEAITLGVHRVSMARGLGLSDFRALSELRRLIQALQIDVAHGHGAKGGAHSRLAARTLRSSGQEVTAIYTPHGGSLNYQRGTAASRLFMGLERQLIGATDGIVFESAFAQAQYLARVGGADLSRRVVFNGLPPEDFHAVVQHDDATDFLFIGELRDIKGVDVLLKALAGVRACIPATLTVVGEGAERAALERLSGELGISGAVRFVGALPAREAFAMGRVVVVPSLKESLPYIVLEAAAAGLPVIATNVGGIGKIVAGTETELVQSGNPDALAAAMAKTRDAPERAWALAAALKARVASEFTITTMADGICAFYADCRVSAPARAA